MHDYIARRSLFSGALASLWTGRRHAIVSQPLHGIFTDHVSVRTVADAYFTQYPAESDLLRLGRLLNGITTEKHLLQAVGRDFARGDIVLIGGWVLARSEARLVAAASLTI